MIIVWAFHVRDIKAHTGYHHGELHDGHDTELVFWGMINTRPRFCWPDSNTNNGKLMYKII